MIRVTCPHCGTETNAADQYAGTSGPCRSCGETITIPQRGASPGGPPGFAPPAKSGGGMSVAIVVVLVCIGFLGCGGVLTLLLLPAVQAAREAARRNNCVNQVRQIELALLNYESVHGEFPPAYVADEDGKPMHSWRVLILPYLEEQALFDQYDMTQPWDSPHNLQLTTENAPAIFACPSRPAWDGKTTDYLGVYGPNSVFSGSTPRRISEIKDGVSNTISVVEVVDSDVHWAEPRDFDATAPIAVNQTQNGIGSSHAGGVAVIGYVDGHVQAVAEGQEQMLKAATTINGNEPPNF